MLKRIWTRLRTRKPKCPAIHECTEHGTMPCQGLAGHRDPSHHNGCLEFDDAGHVWYSSGPTDPGGETSYCS